MPASLLGSSVRRVEDPRLVTGAARFVPDLVVPDMLHAVFIRAAAAHARITMDAAPAKDRPGVAGVFTAVDLNVAPVKPLSKWLPAACARPVLASSVVRFLGEPVAVVVAETRVQAVDAAEAVDVGYEPLGVTVDPLEAMEPGAPLLYPELDSNVVNDKQHAADDSVMEGADVVVEAEFINQRLLASPLETEGILAVPEPDGRLTLWVSTQTPHDVRDEVAASLDLPAAQIRVIAPAVGGGFGAKIGTYPEHRVVAALAQRTGRPVRYVPTRSESMLVLTHGRDQLQRVELGAAAGGRIVGLRVHVIANLGAYPQLGAELPGLTYLMASGPYRIPRIAFRASCVVTNTVPTGAYRGAGRPEATALLERAMDLLAAELAVDPGELRRRNLLAPSVFPYETGTGATYDSGNYVPALDEALRLAGYADLRAEQLRRRERGDVKQLGIGISSYVEVTGGDPDEEFGSVEVGADGRVTVRCGISPHGQGHETSLAQIAASVLRVPFEHIQVVMSDTDRVPRGAGTAGSRSLQLGGSAVFQAAEIVVERARRLAAERLEVDVADVVQTDDGAMAVAGVPERALTLSELAAPERGQTDLTHGDESRLAAEVDVSQGATFPFGTHVALVEVDTETGEVRLLRHVAVDDAGPIVNPMLAQGQIHGGIAQGAAQALYERALYDDGGNLVTGSFATYAVPSAAELPAFENAHTVTRTPRNPLGVKGIGEAGTIGSTPAIHNAVCDAVRHLGVRHIDMPANAERVWRALRDAAGEGTRVSRDAPGAATRGSRAERA